MKASGLLFTVGALCTLACAEPNAVRVFAPACSHQSNLAPALANQVQFLDASLVESGFELERLNSPTTVDFSDALRRPAAGFFFLSFTGHGLRPQNGPSSVCLPPARSSLPKDCVPVPGRPELLDVNSCLLAQLPGELSGAVVVLDACESAQVDPRRAAVPTSVISSSPYVVGSDSLFGDRLAVAVTEARRDPNCDGLVTDQEVFDALLRDTYGGISVAQNRAYPKLRRNSPSHVPLPLAPEPRTECAPVRAQMKALAKNDDPAFASIMKPLRAQLALKPLAKQKQPLPRSDCDYFVIAPGSSNEQDLRSKALQAKLCEFPKAIRERAPAVAAFITFAEVYEISASCDWAQVVRLRDQMLMAHERSEHLEAALPLRRRLSPRQTVSATASQRERERCQYRYMREAPAHAGAPVHCAEAEGQCFLEECPPVGANP